jgi:hypothetical protein
MLQAPAPTGLEAVSYNGQGLPEAMALGRSDRITNAVERVLGRSPRTLRDFCEDYAEVWM